MKKLVYVIALALLLLGPSACNRDDSAPAAPTQPTPPIQNEVPPAGTPAPTPEPAASQGTVTGIAATPMAASGSDHTVILKADGTVWTWGANDQGQLGDGTTYERLTPAQVPGVDGIIAIAAGRGSGAGGDGGHTLALRYDGTVWGWGNGSNGRVGRAGPRRPVPAQLEGLYNVIAIAAGDRHTLALKSDGTVWGLGSNNNDQLGANAENVHDNPTPVQINGFENIIAIAAGMRFSAALRDDGTVWTVGNCGFQRGYEARQVQGLYNITAISSGTSHTLALRNDGTVWAWGDVTFAQVGDGSFGGVVSTPAQVQNLTDIVSISAAHTHSFAVQENGNVWGWGNNNNGRLGDGTSGRYNIAMTPAILDGFDQFAPMITGGVSSVAIANNGYVWAWGPNRDGEVGDGTTDTHYSPVRVLGYSGSGFLNVGR